MIFNTNRWLRICYSVYAPIYNGMTRGFLNGRRRAIELAAIRSGERVLIVGAGTGLDLDYLPPDAQITAIDLTPPMLARLHRRADRLGLQVNVRVMDAQAMEFPDASFDVAILHLVLAVIPDSIACIREVARVLRPGGRAVIFDKFLPDHVRPSPALRAADALLGVLGTRVTKQLGPILASSGLRIVHQEPAHLGGLFKIILTEK